MNNCGYIYIMYNPAFKDMVKIGYATDVEKRRKQLSSGTSIPMPFETYATYEVKEELTDKSLHALIDDINPDMRINGNKEFFKATPEQAYNWLKAIAKISHTSRRLKLYKKKKGTKKKTTNRSSKNIKKLDRSNIKPPFKFSMCNIKPGEQIYFIKDANKVAIVKDDKYVTYNGKEYTLSGLAKYLLNDYRPIQGPIMFTYNGKKLADLRNDI